MITGAHIVLYTKDLEADRVFFSDVLDQPKHPTALAKRLACIQCKMPDHPPRRRRGRVVATM